MNHCTCGKPFTEHEDILRDAKQIVNNPSWLIMTKEQKSAFERAVFSEEQSEKYGLMLPATLIEGVS